MRSNYWIPIFFIFSISSSYCDDAAIVGKRGIVVSAHPLASQVGMHVLMKGGNAVDAAVSMAATLGVVEFEMSGVGGVGNMLIYWNQDPQPAIVNLDFRDKVASGARMEMYDAQTKEVGMRSTCVPGNVAGWHAALDRFGTISWTEALAPAIEFADNGFPIAAREAYYIEQNAEELSRFPTSARVFLPAGRPPRPGELFFQKDLARTLKLIASEGPEVFYRGELADRFVTFSKQQEGVFAKSDFTNYQVDWRQPVRTPYREFEIVSASAPNYGPAIVEAFNILEQFNLSAMEPLDFTHTVAEALKIAADDGMRFIGDPEFVEIPLARLLSKDFGQAKAKQIDPDRATYVFGPSADAAPNNTTAFAVVDSQGSVVAGIQTLISAMGSRVVFGDTGVLFNNNMRKVRSTGPNGLEPGKTFGTPSAPTLVLRQGKPILALGAVGGPDIWQSIVVTLAKILDRDMGIYEAVQSPRFTVNYGYMSVKEGLARDDTFQYRQITMEPDTPALLRQQLSERGHEVVEGTAGNVHVLSIDPEQGILKGVGDPRIGARTLAW